MESRTEPGDRQSDGQWSFTSALREAKRLLLLADKVGDEVELYQVFEPGVSMSPKEIAAHLKDGWGWPGLDTDYLATEAVRELLWKAHEEIQTDRKRRERALHRTTGTELHVLESEADFRRGLQLLLERASFSEILGDSSGDVLDLGAELVMRHVQAAFDREQERSDESTAIKAQFFEQVLPGTTYETYLGAIPGPGATNVEELRAVIESLKRGFSYKDVRIPEIRTSLSERLERVSAWLRTRTNLTFHKDALFAKILDVLNADRSDKVGGSHEMDVADVFYEDLSEVEDAWAVLATMEFVRTRSGGTESLVAGVDDLLRHYQNLEVSGERVKSRDSMCESIHAVKKWLSGSAVRPRRVFNYPDTRSSKFGYLYPPESLFADRMFQYQACIGEVIYDWTQLEDSETDPPEAVDALVGLVEVLSEGWRSVKPLSGDSEEAVRVRGDKFLEGVHKGEFKPGMVNPHLLFKYAAERGITKVGKRGTQKLVMSWAQLKK